VGSLLLLNVVRFVLLGLELAVLARVAVSFVNPTGPGRGGRIHHLDDRADARPGPQAPAPTGLFDFSPLIVVLVIGALLRPLV
jgi:hypothetical protein